MTAKQQRIDAASVLCPPCGLCCNGALFGDVELQKEDDAKRLRDLGMEVFRKGRKQCFHQPCGCFDGSRCRIYAERPARCRAFECRLLLRVRAGEMDVATALKKIAAMRKVLQSLLERVREIGGDDERLPLNQRCAQLLAQPMELSEGRAAAQRRRLMLAMERLMRRLESDFVN